MHYLKRKPSITSQQGMSMPVVVGVLAFGLGTILVVNNTISSNTDISELDEGNFATKNERALRVFKAKLDVTETLANLSGCSEGDIGDYAANAAGNSIMQDKPGGGKWHFGDFEFIQRCGSTDQLLNISIVGANGNVETEATIDWAPETIDGSTGGCQYNCGDDTGGDDTGGDDTGGDDTGGDDTGGDDTGGDDTGGDDTGGDDIGGDDLGGGDLTPP